MCRQDAGIPGIRFFYPRWTSLIRALHSADSEVYYQNCAEYVTGQVAMWCRFKGLPFVYSVASDPDCDPALPKFTFREKMFYRHGLMNASRIIVQTRTQQSMLRKGFNLNSSVLPMPCPSPAEVESEPSHLQGNEFKVIWVGRITKVKRLELLLDVAKKAPDIQFSIVGVQNIDSPYSKEIISKASRLTNVTLAGRVPRDKMPDVYKSASLLCCTSLYEGFPNTFIEAWSYGIPVVSTVDPNNLLSECGLGLRAIDADELVTAIETLRRTPELWSDMSSSARRYYLENHTVDAAMSRFEELFCDVAAVRRF
jgi:glycosyltransferase involved in cell wall biosynthesis